MTYTLNTFVTDNVSYSGAESHIHSGQLASFIHGIINYDIVLQY